MRKFMFLIICLMILAVLIGCETTADAPAESQAAPSSHSAAVSASATAAVYTVTAAAPTTAPMSSPTSVPTPTLEPSPSPAPSVSDPSLYSSYAHMVSYDPAKGVAEFDYFDMLRGDDAVNWLVDHEGYSQAKAEAEVADYADSEFIEKNTNSQLREIDLKNVPITLMFDPETGEMLEPDHPLHGTLTDLYNLYELDNKLVLKSLFYWIEVKSGKVTSVEQVYWP